MNWVTDAFRKYAVFDGRSRRREYWHFALFNFVVILVLLFVDGWLGMISHATGFGPLSGLYALGILVPSVAVTVRRLHDTGRSGWWVLLGIVPLIGEIVILVFMCLDSQPGANRFGPNPKGVIGAGISPGGSAAHV